MAENVFRAAGLGLLVNSDTEIIDVEALTLHDDHIFRTHQRHLLPTTQAVEEYSPFPTLHTPLEFAWSSPIVAKGGGKSLDQGAAPLRSQPQACQRTLGDASRSHSSTA